MFDSILVFGMTFPQIVITTVVLIMGMFIAIFFASMIKNRKKVKFYSLVIGDDGSISKVGISFIFILMLIIYQVVAQTEISGYLVELLGVIFAAELGTKYVDSKLITPKQIDTIKESVGKVDTSVKTSPARNTENINFDNL